MFSNANEISYFLTFQIKGNKSIFKSMTNLSTFENIAGGNLLSLIQIVQDVRNIANHTNPLALSLTQIHRQTHTLSLKFTHSQTHTLEVIHTLTLSLSLSLTLSHTHTNTKSVILLGERYLLMLKR